MIAETEPIAIVRAEDGYRGLLDAFRKRHDQLNVRGLVLDAIAGLPDGYTGKLHAGYKMFGKDSFGPTLGSHAVMLVMIEDAEALAAIQSRLKKRDEKQTMRSAARYRETTIRISRKTFKEMGSRGGKACMRKRSKRQRRLLAKQAARARWNRVREQREAVRNAPGQTADLAEQKSCQGTER